MIQKSLAIAKEAWDLGSMEAMGLVWIIKIQSINWMTLLKLIIGQIEGNMGRPKKCRGEWDIGNIGKLAGLHMSGVSECWRFYAVSTARAIFTAKTSLDICDPLCKNQPYAPLA